MNVEEMDDQQIETEARKQGWKPEEEWKGDPPSRGFVTAKEFIAAGQESLPLVTKEKDRLQDELDEVKNELGKLRQANNRYVEFTNKALTKERERNQRLIGELEAERAQAITDSDGEKAVAAERKIKELEDENASLQPQDTSIQDWMGDNEWYGKDPELAAMADGLSMQLQKESPGLQGRAHLDELSKRVKKAMPHKFKNPKREEAPPVGGGTRTPVSNGHTFEDLPADAKAAFEDFKQMMEGIGKEYTKEQYLKSYEWDD